MLKPGGVFALADNVTVDDPEAADYYNAIEKLRDPSHFRVHSLGELATMCAAAGLGVRCSAKLTKEFEFHQWADRQRCSDRTKQLLLQKIDRIPDPLRPLLRPRRSRDTLYFSLWEAVIVADRH